MCTAKLKRFKEDREVDFCGIFLEAILSCLWYAENMAIKEKIMAVLEQLNKGISKRKK